MNVDTAGLAARATTERTPSRSCLEGHTGATADEARLSRSAWPGKAILSPLH